MIGALVILCFAAVAAENQTELSSPDVPPGCGNRPIPVMFMSQCCANFPSFFSTKDMEEKCKTCNGKAGAFCCATDCVLNVTGAIIDGKFDGDKAKTVIAKMVAGKPKWTSSLIGSIVDDCVSNAPNKLNDWRNEVSAAFDPKCSDATSLNMIIIHYIHREMFFQCPGLIENGYCKELFDYGQGCALFPLHER